MKIKNIVAALAVACGLAAPAMAQDTPLRIVLGAPPGGSVDAVLRSLAAVMSEELKQQIIVENRPGGLAVIAAEHVAQSAPDGNTLLLAFTGYTAAPFVAKDFRFDIREQTMIGQFGVTPLVLFAGGQTGFKSVADLVKAAKAAPGKLNFASSEGTTRIYGELFNQLTGIDAVHVPYKGGAQAAGDIAGGAVQYGFGAAGGILGLHRAGRVQILAVANSVRLAPLPDVPTMKEAGVAGFDLAAWAGLTGPKGIPEARRTQLEAALSRATKAPAFVNRMTELGAVTEFLDGAALKRRIDQEMALAKKTAEAAKIVPE